MSSVEKPVEYAAFAVIRNPVDRSHVLVVKRPEEDEEIGGMWGLPATPVKKDEGIVEAVERIGDDKLGVELDVDEFIGRGSIDRGEYLLYGELYEATISRGTPEVPQPAEGKPGTQYVDWRWVDEEDVADVISEVAQHGSLCTNIYLDHIGEETYLEF